MCLLVTNVVYSNPEPITCYKVLTTKKKLLGRKLYSPYYKHYSWRVRKIQEPASKPFFKSIRGWIGLVAEEGFFHSFKNVGDAEHEQSLWGKDANARVVVCEIPAGCTVAEGFTGLNDADGYASTQLKIIKIVK